MVAASQVWQAHEAAAERPGERLARIGPNRTADRDAIGRRAKTLRGRIAHLNDADVVNLILRIGVGCYSRRRSDNSV